MIACSYHQDLQRTDQVDELLDRYDKILEKIGVQRWYVFWGLWDRS
jgi:hypothetical protein